jgi:hypothetical protein
MAYAQRTIYTLYKKLLALYPREFRERLGESMEQTFNDLCKEKRQAKKGLLGVIVWAFVETAIGIFRERLLLITKGNIMRLIFTNLGSSAFISFLLVLPFMVMEFVNRQSFFIPLRVQYPAACGGRKGSGLAPRLIPFICYAVAPIHAVPPHPDADRAESVASG